jgi:hypothetical protein
MMVGLFGPPIGDRGDHHRADVSHAWSEGAQRVWPRQSAPDGHAALAISTLKSTAPSWNPADWPPLKKHVTPEGRSDERHRARQRTASPEGRFALRART